MINKVSRVSFILSFVLASLSVQKTYAASIGEAELVASGLSAEAVSDWLAGLEKKPKSIGIFSIRVSAPLEQDYVELFEAKLIRQIQAQIPDLKVVKCYECRAPQVVVKGESLQIKKGAPDLDSLKELAKKNDVESFMTIEVSRTKLSLITQPTLNIVATGETFPAETIKIPAWNMSDGSFMIGLQMAPGLVLGSTIASDNVPFSVTLLLLEELGFGKGGLSVGGVFAGSAGTMAYILPTLGWRGRFKATGITSLFSAGVGFGAVNRIFGPSTRLAYDVFFSSFVSVGVDTALTLPLQGSGGSLPMSFVGLHIGVSLGR